MSECTAIADLLSGFLDRDLPADSCRDVERHLAECPRCGADAEALRETIDLCRQYRGEDRPGPLAEDKKRQLREALRKVLDHQPPPGS